MPHAIGLALGSPQRVGRLLASKQTFAPCRHPYTRSLTLTNASKLPSKFEVVPQENQSKGLALIKVEPEAGGIPALGSQTVQVTLKTSRLGRIQLPLRIKVVTSTCSCFA